MFELKEEHVMLRDMVREFAERELAPRLAEFESAGRLPEDVIRKIAELNLFGLAFPKELGGADAGLMGYVLAAEELARVSVDAAFMCSVSIGATYPLLFAGSEEQKEKYLKPMVGGEKLGAFALTEPNAGSDAASIETVAIKEGDEYVLNGRKVFITNASIADTYIVFAYTDKSKGAKGISAFIVERGMEGFSFGKIEDKLGMRASVVGELVFNECRVPVENLLGNEGEGFKIAMATLDRDRTGLAAVGVGLSQACLDAAKKYAKERKQFGQPLARFQHIQFTIADMAVETEAARLLTYKAASLADAGKRFSKEAAMAKLYASEVAMRSAINAVQIHGAYGCTRDYPVERYFRDAKVLSIAVGTSEMQRLVISREEFRS